ncbi:ferredoxin [Streptomyces hainanensis]|uniref:Ferredoxin n=1 Tax=Streptomyces hainanensis TaxID=402648 RepID=A0A4R4TL42_9ACTN|nr:ferredoxin [Streptomyces hainanensis]TDC76474.1 ferredoxin [Streptomyces hainanensis]
MTARLAIDTGRCIGTSLCAATAPPHHVALGTDERAHLLPNAPVLGQEALDAIDLCPVEAIHLLPADSTTEERP